MELDGFEPVALFAFGLFGLISWFGWYWSLVRVTRLGGSLSHRLALALTPVVCALGLLQVLRFLADEVVRAEAFWQFYYMAIGAGWLAGVMRLVSYMGISVRDDVLERRNTAALPALQGALIGLTLCFAGANVGNGPGVHVVILSAGLSTALLLAIWLAVDRLSGPGIAERITVERDLASGIRLAGLLVALGCILGAAVAGAWVDLTTTVVGFFLYAWPAALLGAVAVLTERRGAGAPLVGSVIGSVLAAGLYVAFAVGYVARQGLA
ncbi:MAG: hypothetical protein ACRD24_03870 [Terriglobales bacterium]